MLLHTWLYHTIHGLCIYSKIQCDAKHLSSVYYNHDFSFVQALADSLSVLLEQEREESEEQLRTLKDEMEEVLGELSAMEEQEQRRQEVVEKSQEALQSMQEENTELESQLREARALLGR